MRDEKNNFIKKLAIVALFFLQFLFSTKSLYANENFKIELLSTYIVSEDGKVKVTNKITIENLVSELFAESFVLHLENINPEKLAVIDKDGKINLLKVKENNSSKLVANFTKPLVGKGERRSFVIEYEDNRLYQKIADISSVTIPKLINRDFFDSYKVNLIVPKSFGSKSYSTASASKESHENDTLYIFDDREKIAEGIRISFGEFQIFTFDISYHLDNPINEIIQLDVALPPDTSYQKMFYDSIVPKPSNVYIDTYGNWIAKYTLKPRESATVNARGRVHVYSSPRNITGLSKFSETSGSFWDEKDEKARALSELYNTPNKITNYTRGLVSKDQVIPNEININSENYVNTFIKLALMSNIPARGISGYLFVDKDVVNSPPNSNILHYWLEYWDAERSGWVPVDLLKNKSNTGLSNNFNHIVFAIHGKNPLEPIPAGSFEYGNNPAKNVIFRRGNIDKSLDHDVSIQTKYPISFIPFESPVEITIINDGPAAIYDKSMQIYFDKKIIREDYVQTLPPFGVYKTEITIPSGFLGTNLPDKIEVKFDNQNILLRTMKSRAILINFVELFTLIVLFLIFLILREGKLKHKLSRKIRSIKDRVSNKFVQKSRKQMN